VNRKRQNKGEWEKSGCGKNGMNRGAFILAGEILRPLYQKAYGTTFTAAIMIRMNRDYSF
jgi:hypothetical protein